MHLLIENDTLEKILNHLINNNLTVATAESCTGGLIAHTLTNISGSSVYFDRGVVTYSNKAKIELLGLNNEILDKFGAVSHKVAEAMAKGIRIKSHVDIGIATTGIAGPTGGTPDKPVGLVYIGISTSKQTNIKKFKFSGNRLQNKELTCNAALKMILDNLKR